MQTQVQSRASSTGLILLLGTLAILPGWAGSARAEEAADDYPVAAQPLGGALTEFAEEADLKLMFPAELARGIASLGVAGTLTRDQALARLLAGTGMRYRYTSPDTVTIERPDPLQDLVNDAKKPLQIAENGPTPAVPAKTGADQPTVLEELTVTASPRDETGYNVPDTTTATKTDTPIFDTPVAIQVVPYQVLQDQQITQIRDAVRNVSGVQHAGFSYDGLYDVFTIRGFRTGNYGIAYRDGFRLRTPHINVANVERVEVLKGASAGLYGRIEPGGLVNVVIKKPQAESYYAAEQQFGQFDYYRTTLDATGPLNADKSLLYRGVFSYQDAGSFRDEKENERILVSPSLTWDLSRNTQVHLNFEYEHTEDFLDSGLVALDGRPAPVSIERYLGVLGLLSSPTDYYIADSHVSHRFNEDWTAKLRGAWWRRDATYFDAAPLGGVNADGRTVDLYLSTFYEQDDDTYLAEIYLTGSVKGFGLEHDLLLAAEYYNVDSVQFSFFDTAPNLPLRPLDIFDPDYQHFSSFRQVRNSFFNPNDEWYAFTIQDLVRVSDRLKLLASGLGFGAGLFAASQRQGDAPNTFQLPGYVRVDAAASYKLKLAGSSVTAQLNVHNLLDKEYYDGTAGGFGTEEARNFIYPGAPRTVVGSVRFEF